MNYPTSDTSLPERIRFAANILREIDKYIGLWWAEDSYYATRLENIADEIEHTKKANEIEIRGLAEAIADIGLNHGIGPQQLAKQLVELGWHKGQDK